MSGGGYGLLFLLGVIFTLDPGLLGRAESLAALALGTVFVIAGLLSSILHLGQPQRAWRAFSQWRSSWLSREGVASVVSFVPMLALAWCVWRGTNGSIVRALGASLAVLAVLTVICTAKIYTSLKTISAWHNSYVLPGYLMMGLFGGTAWLEALLTFATSEWSGYDDLKRVIVPVTNNLVLQWVCSITIMLLASTLFLLKKAYWCSTAAAAPTSTIESATGLGRFGRVRSVEAPHTEENYLTREMGFVLARKHGKRLRAICLILIGPVPAAAAALSVLLASMDWPALMPVFAIATALSVTFGLFVERWLFFAQAKHLVMLYYDGARP